MDIKLVSSEVDNICSRIRSAKSKGNGATGKVSSAKSVDPDISSRLNIAGDLNYLSKNVSWELYRLDSLIDALRLAVDEFEDADQDVRSESRSLAYQIRKAKWEAFWETIHANVVKKIEVFIKKWKELLATLGIIDAAATSGLITGGTSVVLLAHLVDIMKKGDEKEGDTAAAQTDSEEQEEEQNTMGESNALPAGTKEYEFEGEKYTTIDDFDQYIYSQLDYDEFLNENGKNVGCSATAWAMGKSMLKDKAIDPRSDWGPNGAYFSGMNSRQRVQNLGELGVLQISYDELMAGKPSLLYFHEGKNQHYITVVGMREGADRNNLMSGDLLILDPGYKQQSSKRAITTLDDFQARNSYVDTLNSVLTYK